MRVFTIKWFSRWARKEGITDAMLCAVIADMQVGNTGDELGGYVFKKRLAKPGEGKRGGWRVLIAFRIKDKAFFVYGFAKNDRDNIGKQELKALKEYAKTLLGYSSDQLKTALEAGELNEVNCDE